MAFFKFRWSGQSEQVDKPAQRSRTAQVESIEAMRRRARHRLMGAAVLVLLGVVGFPLLFDTQPRPIPVDIPIEIPDRNKVAPLVVPAPVPAAALPAAQPAASAAQHPAAPAGKTGASAPSRQPTEHAPAGAGLGDGEELVSASRTAPKPAPGQPAASAQPKSEAKPVVRHEPKPVPKQDAKLSAAPHVPERKSPSPDESARARALLEGGAAEPAGARAEAGRFIVQVGAFADADKAREVRMKLERAGLKTYTQVVDTKDGKRTRVRVGPFASRADADKATARIQGLGLPASALAL